MRRQVGPGLLQGGAQVRVVGGQRKTLVALAGTVGKTKEIEDDFFLRFDYVGMDTLLLVHSEVPRKNLYIQFYYSVLHTR